MPEFFFISHAEINRKLDLSAYKMSDATCLCRLNPSEFDYGGYSIHTRAIRYCKRKLRYFKSIFFKTPSNVHKYSDVIKLIDTELFEQDKIYPAIVPNWDQSPRKGISSLIYHNSTPDLFYKHVKMILKRIEKKDDEDQVIFLKSWNEWAEGNYMEPDLKWGKGYIKALRKALDEFNNE